MPTRVFRMQLDPGQAAEYQRRHDSIWPELRTALLDAGADSYRIFLDPDTHHLIAILEHREQHHLDELAQLPVMQRWWQFMQDIMVTRADASPVTRDLQLMFRL